MKMINSSDILRFIKDNSVDLPKEELERIIEEELNKHENEMDADLIEYCLDALNSDDWEINSYYDSQRGILKFGFSAAGIGNKDYCSAFHTSKAHKASVSNSEETTVTSDSASAGSYTSTVKVTHAARPVWSAIY